MKALEVDAGPGEDIPPDFLVVMTAGRTQICPAIADVISSNADIAEAVEHFYERTDA